MGILEKLTWLGHAGFRIIWEGKQIVIDPYHTYRHAQPADLILITHPHFDHWSPEDVRRMVGGDTVIIAPPDCESNVGHEITPIRQGEHRTIFGKIKVETVPAYNIGKPYHPKERGWHGYVLTLGNQRLYHAGDTDATPEMRALSVDIALLPVGGTYTMNAEEAAAAANAMRARVVVPMHYGSIVGTINDAKTFEQRVEGKEVHVFMPS